MNRADLKLYTPDRWYYVMYENGREISQYGCKTKELAQSWFDSIEESVRQQEISLGRKRRPEVTSAVVEAKGWSVDGKVFRDYHDALWYKWNERPNATIKGVFES